MEMFGEYEGNAFQQLTGLYFANQFNFGNISEVVLDKNTGKILIGPLVDASSVSDKDNSLEVNARDYARSSAGLGTGFIAGIREDEGRDRMAGLITSLNAFNDQNALDTVYSGARLGLMAGSLFTSGATAISPMFEKIGVNGLSDVAINNHWLTVANQLQFPIKNALLQLGAGTEKGQLKKAGLEFLLTALPGLGVGLTSKALADTLINEFLPPTDEASRLAQRMLMGYGSRYLTRSLETAMSVELGLLIGRKLGLDVSREGLKKSANIWVSIGNLVQAENFYQERQRILEANKKLKT
jgi:hypothetical protein